MSLLELVAGSDAARMAWGDSWAVMREGDFGEGGFGSWLVVASLDVPIVDIVSVVFAALAHFLVGIE